MALDSTKLKTLNFYLITEKMGIYGITTAARQKIY
ncbi:MAG: hypothetical protein H6R42_668 [Nitrospirae bacterium]|nr:hypothetical protein [Nitrospirota bacterium]